LNVVVVEELNSWFSDRFSQTDVLSVRSADVKGIFFFG